MWVLSWVNIEQFLKEKKEKTLCAKLLNPLLLTDMSRERKEICCSYNISFQAQKQFRWNWDSFSREYAMKMLSALQLYGVGVFKSCVYPSRKDRRIMVIREPSGFLTYLLTKGRTSCFSYCNSWCVITDVTLSADKGSLFFLGIVNGCRIRIGIPVGNAVGIAWIYQVSYSKLHPRGLIFYAIQTFFHFLLHF